MGKFVERFVISDTHFGHKNATEVFLRSCGAPLRDFASVEECDEAMVERWNAKVKPSDSVYHLGDVVIARRHLETVKRLNGRKILIKGNHDIFRDSDYYNAGFEQIHGVRVFVDKFILSHVPLHPDCVTERFRVNIHGHLHSNQITRSVVVQENPFGYSKYETQPDPRYLCVSVEQTDFAPLHFDEVEERIQQRWKEYNYTPPEKAGWGNGSNPG